MTVTEYGDAVFNNIDEWGRINTDGLLEDGIIVVIRIIFGSATLSGTGDLFVIVSVFAWGGKGRQFYGYLEKKRFPKRSLAATEFINELKEKIMETGIVKNTHKPYDPRTNRRYKVSKRQAFRVAYSIAKSKGMRVGKYRGPN